MGDTECGEWSGEGEEDFWNGQGGGCVDMVVKVGFEGRFGRDTRCIVMDFQDSLDGLGACLALNRQVVKHLKASWLYYDNVAREFRLLRRSPGYTNTLRLSYCARYSRLHYAPPNETIRYN
jgi:hypothetical protein